MATVPSCQNGTMNARTFEKFREVVYARSGISLGPQKAALVSARVGKRMRALRLENHEDYLDYLLHDETGNELVQFLDAISTNVTSFFREPKHFEFLAETLRKWHAKGQKRFRIWSAASSTGEEPYSIAMTVLEALGSRGMDVRVLATDISTRVLESCLCGEYEAGKLDTVPETYRSRYFEVLRDGSATRFRVREMLKNLVVFRRLNLSEPPFPMRGPLDVVFCRNVMIYFDNCVRGRLLDEVYRLLKPGGYLMVGHAESLTGMMSEFRTIQPSVYVKR